MCAGPVTVLDSIMGTMVCVVIVVVSKFVVGWMVVMGLVVVCECARVGVGVGEDIGVAVTSVPTLDSWVSSRCSL